MVALSRIWAKSHILKGWRLSKWSIFSHIKLYFLPMFDNFSRVLWECVCTHNCMSLQFHKTQMCALALFKPLPSEIWLKFIMLLMYFFGLMILTEHNSDHSLLHQPQFPKASLPFFFSTGISKLFNNQPVPREILQITLHYKLWSDATRYLKTGKNKDISNNITYCNSYIITV